MKSFSWRFSVAWLSIFIVPLISVPVLAEVAPQYFPQKNEPSSSQSTTSLGLSIYAERQHQRFEEGSADINTIALNPYFQHANWSLALDIPWQKVEGDYFVNSFQPSLPNICNQVNNLTAQQLNVFIHRRPNAQALINSCIAQRDFINSDGNVSGLSDISAYLTYGKLLGREEIWYGSITAGLKWDNAEVGTGLGSGSKDLIVDASLNADTGVWISTLRVGYSAVISEQAGVDYDNYAYFSADIGRRIGKYVKVEVRGEWQQAASEFNDEVVSAAAYVVLFPLDNMKIRLTITDYINTEDYPEEEITVSIILSY